MSHAVHVATLFMHDAKLPDYQSKLAAILLLLICSVSVSICLFMVTVQVCKAMSCC